MDDKGHPTYTIKTVADFLQVPEDRIDRCLEEFAMCLHTVRHTMAIIKLMTEEQGVEVPADAIQFPEFTWIDDDEKIARIQFEERDVNSMTIVER